MSAINHRRGDTRTRTGQDGRGTRHVCGTGCVLSRDVSPRGYKRAGNRWYRRACKRAMWREPADPVLPPWRSGLDWEVW